MAEKKKIIANIKMRIPAGQASPAPPVGSILGQYGVNMMDFINPFNEQTADYRGQNVIAHVTVYEDRSFTFKVRRPATDDMILAALKIQKGSGEPNKTKAGKLSQAQLTEIAEAKIEDLNTTDIEQAKKVVAGTARSMGIEVEE